MDMKSFTSFIKHCMSYENSSAISTNSLVTKYIEGYKDNTISFSFIWIRNFMLQLQQ